MINIPKGTKDVLPNQSYRWHFIEGTVRDLARKYCINEIRTPIFEHTELFLRGVGDTTDIVNKEMYTFLDKGNRSITLKPEGTSCVARAFVESSLHGQPQPTKMYYITPVFRYERPQNGRLREHHQFGVEYYGSTLPNADIEVMQVAANIFKTLGIGNLTLSINSIGCEKCRPNYNKVLKEFLSANLNKMCTTCHDRYEKNPLRILDCKERNCIAINADAPLILDYICDDCREHHEAVCTGLENLCVNYNVNPRIVRGLDYYTRTVFEFISENIGAQGTVCGGGRYNNLVEEVGGKPCPAVGFGMGIERLMMILDNLDLSCGTQYSPDVYVAPICDEAKGMYMSFVSNLREHDLVVESDLMSRSLKAQMKYANKLNAKYVILLGEDELNEQSCSIKDMETGESNRVKIDKVIEFIKEGK